MKRYWGCLLSFAVLLAFPAGLFAESLSPMVVFGDSLSDTGNLYIATGGLEPAPPNYTTGLFTDGPDSVPSTNNPLGVWVQQLAGMRGITSPAPSLAGGTDYAYGGALTGHDPNSGGVPWVTDQVNMYLSSNPGGVSASALYVFWAGANDIFQGVSPATAVSNLTANVNALYGAGARDFMWLDMPPLGDTPDGIGSGYGGELNELSEEYNSDWLAAIGLLDGEDPGIDIYGVDVYTLVEDMLADPGAYGFTNVTDPAQGLDVNPNTYLFWDGVHPTTVGHFWVANLANDDLNTPEPQAALLLGTGLLAGLLLVWRRQSASV